MVRKRQTKADGGRRRQYIRRHISRTSDTTNQNSSERYAIVGDEVAYLPRFKRGRNGKERDLKELDDRNMEGKLSGKSLLFMMYMLWSPWAEPCDYLYTELHHSFGELKFQAREWN